MSSYKEDQEIFILINSIIDIEDKLGKRSPHIVAPELEREELEKKSKQLHREYTTSKIEIDRIRIRETPYEKIILDFLRNDLAYSPVNTEEFNEFWNFHYEEILEFHQDNELIDRGTFISNYYKLIPPYIKVGIKIPDGIKNIYHESRWCFVYGQHSASIALSRTVIETVLKNKFNIIGNLDEIIKIAENRNIISKTAAWNANKVRIAANRILHKAEPAKEKEAKNAIDHVLNFLEEIYL